MIKLKNNKITDGLFSLLVSTLFFLSFLVYADSSDIEQLEEQLGAAYAQETLVEFGGDLDELLEKSPTSPGLWYIKGMWYRALGLQRYYELGKVNDDLVRELMQKKNDAISKAMELDIDHEPHLTAGQYHHFATGLPTDLKVEAYRRELKLGGAVTYPIGTENLYGRMRAAYYDEGRYEEAIAVLKEMMENPAVKNYRARNNQTFDDVMAKIQEYEQKILERDAQVRVSKEEPEKVVAADDSDQATQAPEQDDSSQSLATQALSSEPEVAKVSQTILWVIVGVVLAGIIIIYLVRVNRRK